MTFTTSRWGPSQTSPIIRRLIFATCFVALLSALTHNLFSHFLAIPSPQELLSLSWYGISHYFLWQPFTYLFVQTNYPDGITLFFLLALFFNMYILWILGSTLQEDIGTKNFLWLYFGAGITSGVIAAFAMPLFGQYSVLAGPSAALLGLFVVWTMFYAESILTLFFLIPVRTKWLLAGILGAIALIAISQVDLVSLTFYFTASLYCYLYGVLVLRLRSPYAFIRPLDQVLENLASHLRPSEPKTAGESKIVDLKGKPVLDDEAFIDAMLTKISKYGEKSLTTHERLRMQQISEKRQRR